MNYFKTKKLMDKYCNCPKCGSDSLGNGQGGLIIECETFRRWCKCGFDKTVTAEDVEIKLSVK